MPNLRSQFDEIVSLGPDVLYNIMEIGSNAISGRDPLCLADDVFELAQSFSARGVRTSHGSYCVDIFSRTFETGRRDSRFARILTTGWSRTIYSWAKLHNRQPA